MGTKKPSKPDPAAALHERAVGCVGASYDHARAATINAACSRPRSSGAAAAGSRRSIGQVPPAEAAARYPAEPEATAWAAASRPTKLPPRSPARFSSDELAQACRKAAPPPPSMPLGP